MEQEREVPEAREVPDRDPLVTPRGRFPHARVAGEFIYVSGTSSRRPDNSIVGAEVDEMGTTSLDIRAQTRAVLHNIDSILRRHGAQLSDLVQTTVFLVSMNDFKGFNEVWAQEFGDAAPTRTTVAVHQLPHPHLLIEIQAVAHRPGPSTAYPKESNMAVPPVFNFNEWVSEHEQELKPPVNNKQMYTPDGDFIVQVVGGPNQRNDFHVDPYEEWFFQVRGNMHVNVIDDGVQRRIDIREGDVWLLPRSMPHSPQRPEVGSIGIVVERIREEGTLEKFQWYCFNCSALVHEVQLQVRDLVADMPPVFAAFYADEQARTCGSCGALHPGKG